MGWLYGCTAIFTNFRREAGAARLPEPASRRHLAIHPTQKNSRCSPRARRTVGHDWRNTDGQFTSLVASSRTWYHIVPWRHPTSGRLVELQHARLRYLRICDPTCTRKRLGTRGVDLARRGRQSQAIPEQRDLRQHPRLQLKHTSEAERQHVHRESRRRLPRIRRQ